MRRAATVLLVALVGVFMAFYGGYDVDAESGYGELDVPGFLVWFAPGVASSDVPVEADWVDITSYVARLSTVTGRDDEFTQPSSGQLDLDLDNLDGRFDPDNTSGPYYGQLLPLVWVRVTSGAALGSVGVFYGQVSIEGFRVTASAFPNLVTVEVLDMIEQLANTQTPESVYAIEVLADEPVGWWRLDEQSGTRAVDSSGGGLHGTYENGLTFNSRTGLIAESGDNAIAFSEDDDRISFSEPHVSAFPFTVEAWVQVEAADVPLGTRLIWHQVGAKGLGLVEGTALSLVGTQDTPDEGKIRFGVENMTGTRRNLQSSVSVADGQPHHVVATVTNGTTSSLYVDGVDVTTVFSSSGTPTLTPAHATIGNQVETFGIAPFPGTLDEVAVYDTALSSARVAAHYAAGTAPWASELTGARITHILDAIDFPAGQRTIATGASTLQSASLNADAWSLLLATATAEGGVVDIDHYGGGKVRFRGRRDPWTETRSLTSQATFGDGGGSEVPYASLDVQDDRIYNHSTMQRRDGASVTVSDAASATQYQRRTFSETGLLYETDAESQYRAERIVAEKKDRHRRVRSITLEPLEDTDLAWAQVFAREVGDRITVNWSPLYGGTYTYDCWIEGIRHSFDAEIGRLRTTFSLSPVPFDTTGEPYWIAGVSRAGTTTRPGY